MGKTKTSVLTEVIFLWGKTDSDVNKYPRRDANGWWVLQGNRRDAVGTVKAGSCYHDLRWGTTEKIESRDLTEECEQNLLTFRKEHSRQREEKVKGTR